MIEIPLSKKGKHAGKYVAIVDDYDADLAEFNWTLSHNYANRTAKDGRRSIIMHRVVLERVLGRPLEKSELVDHINMNGLDNRRENLRVATKSQNSANTKPRSSNKSGYKGVSWDKSRQRWRSRIRHNGQYFWLGYFDNLQDAYSAYCKKAKELFGEYAKLDAE